MTLQFLYLAKTIDYMIFANFYLFDHPLCIVRARRLFLQAVEDQVVPKERANKSNSLIYHPAD